MVEPENSRGAELKNRAARSSADPLGPQVRREDEHATMLKVMNSRGPRPQSPSWAMTLCMGLGAAILILALVQLLR